MEWQRCASLEASGLCKSLGARSYERGSKQTPATHPTPSLTAVVNNLLDTTNTSLLYFHADKDNFPLEKAGRKLDNASKANVSCCLSTCVITQKCMRLACIISIIWSQEDCSLEIFISQGINEYFPPHRSSTELRGRLRDGGGEAESHPSPITYVYNGGWEGPSADWILLPGFLLLVIKSFQSTLNNRILHKSPFGPSSGWLLLGDN